MPSRRRWRKSDTDLIARPNPNPSGRTDDPDDRPRGQSPWRRPRPDRRTRPVQLEASSTGAPTGWCEPCAPRACGLATDRAVRRQQPRGLPDDHRGPSRGHQLRAGELALHGRRTRARAVGLRRAGPVHRQPVRGTLPPRRWPGCRRRGGRLCACGAPSGRCAAAGLPGLRGAAGVAARRQRAARPDGGGPMFYTSGTTGRPKGVVRGAGGRAADGERWPDGGGHRRRRCRFRPTARRCCAGPTTTRRSRRSRSSRCWTGFAW